jgi:hypothetical protein
MLEQNGNLENKVEHILISKTKFWLGIIMFIIPILSFFFKIQLDIALIKQNHIAHTQISIEKIADLEEEQVKLMEKIDNDHDVIIKLLQMHEK